MPAVCSEFGVNARLNHLVAYLSQEKGIGLKRSRLSEIFRHEGLRWKHEKGWLALFLVPLLSEPQACH